MLKRHFSHTLFVQLVSALVRCSLLSIDHRILSILLFEDLASVTDKTIQSGKDHAIVRTESQEETTATIDNEKIIAHDALTPEQIDELKQKNSQEHRKSMPLFFFH